MLIAVLLAGASACHERSSSTTTPTSAPPPVAANQPVPQNLQRQPMTHDCPTEVPGTIVNVDRFDGGIALVFTTLIGDVNDLRARVHHTAEQIERERTTMVGQGEATPPQGEGYTIGNVPATATAIDIDAGARLELRPVSEMDLESLRAAAEQRATQMASGQCARQEPAA